MREKLPAMSPDPTRKFGLPPVVDRNTLTLILGALPSDISLAAQQYYANPGNDFWKLLGSALNLTLQDLTYQSRIAALQAHRIGLWDAYHSAIRPGSMDESITAQILNNFAELKPLAPNLKQICFNGKHAAKANKALTWLGYKTLLLPSSSGANRRNQDVRMKLWIEAIASHTVAHGGD